MALVNGGEKCNLITAYTNTGNTEVSYGKNRWLAQTFTIADLFVVFMARFRSWTTCPGFFYDYALYNTDGTGKPTGLPISTTTISPTGEAISTPGKWRYFDFWSFPNLPAGVYALVASAPTAPTTLCKKIRCDDVLAVYPWGKAWQSDNSGIDWSEIPHTDLIFEVWGWKPPPTSNPTPVISNWAPLSVVYTPRLDGFNIILTTDIPCHLYMRWTDKEPLKHPMSEVRRGILVPIGTRFCFVAWHENEQMEPGDTLIHTFHKDNWPICQTRWFYFIGTKQAQEQPSASPIFTLHRTHLVPPLGYIGAPAIDRPDTSWWFGIQERRTEEWDGYVTVVEAWLKMPTNNLWIGIWEPLGGDWFRCRSFADLGPAAAGVKLTYPVNLAIMINDKIAIETTSTGTAWGHIEASMLGGAGVRWLPGHTGGKHFVGNTLHAPITSPTWDWSCYGKRY